MADFSKSVAGAYFITSCYKYAVATGIFLFFVVSQFFIFQFFPLLFPFEVLYYLFVLRSCHHSPSRSTKIFFFLTAALGAARALLKLQYSPLLALDLMMAVALKIQGRLQDPEDGGALCKWRASAAKF